MGVGTLSKKTYYSITNGLISRAFKEPTQFSKSRINKNGKEVHEEFYEYISGIMTGITTKDSEFGRFWIVTFQDGKDEFVLQMNYSSGYSQAFLKMLPNVDLKKKVQLIPKLNTDKDTGKKKASLFITQDGAAIKWYYTKDNPNGIPELKGKPGKGKDKGKTIWDDSDIMEFLEDMVKTDIIPNLPKKINAEDFELIPTDHKPGSGNAAGGGEEAEEKLPF